ncbi:hypothetical protein M885DRAFT_505439 [Pelagophyceae sp. CCMP2097]|nr:hypothetical protein M885DRAFT_505439 [Pelagophyceae sp. CCMP2097]
MHMNFPAPAPGAFASDEAELLRAEIAAATDERGRLLAEIAVVRARDAWGDDSEDWPFRAFCRACSWPWAPKGAWAAKLARCPRGAHDRMLARMIASADADAPGTAGEHPDAEFARALIDGDAAWRRSDELYEEMCRRPAAGEAAAAQHAVASALRREAIQKRREQCAKSPAQWAKFFAQHRLGFAQRRAAAVVQKETDGEKPKPATREALPQWHVGLQDAARFAVDRPARRDAPYLEDLPFSLDDYGGARWNSAGFGAALGPHLAPVLRGIVRAAQNASDAAKLARGEPDASPLQIKWVPRELRALMLAAKRPVYDVVRSIGKRSVKLQCFGDVLLRFVRSLCAAMEAEGMRYDAALCALDVVVKWLKGTALVPPEADYTSPRFDPPACQGAAPTGGWRDAETDVTQSLILRAMAQIVRNDLDSRSGGDVLRVVARSLRGGDAAPLGKLASVGLPWLVRNIVLRAAGSLQDVLNLRLASSVFRAILEPARLQWCALVGPQRHRSAAAALARLTRIHDVCGGARAAPAAAPRTVYIGHAAPRLMQTVVSIVDCGGFRLTTYGNTLAATAAAQSEMSEPAAAAAAAAAPTAAAPIAELEHSSANSAAALRCVSWTV